MEYFVIFKPQTGQLEPAYSYVDDETLQTLTLENAVEWFIELDNPQHTKEEVKVLIEQHKAA